MRRFGTLVLGIILGVVGILAGVYYYFATGIYRFARMRPQKNVITK